MAGEGTTTPTVGADPYFVNPGAGNAGAWDQDTVTSRTELLGHLRNKGWDKLSHIDVVREAVKSHHEAERALGIPKEQIIRAPKDAADAEGWAAFNKRMGVPEKAEAYDLSKIKFSDGGEVDESFVAPFKAAFHAAGVRPEQAASIMAAVVKNIESAESTEAAAFQANIAQERDALMKSWGNNAETNKFIATQAAIKLGFDESVVAALEKAAGYEKTMQGLLRAGQALGEARFIADPSKKGGEVMTREQASDRLAALKRDDSFVAKVNAGDSAANEEFNNLLRIVSMGA